MAKSNQAKETGNAEDRYRRMGFMCGLEIHQRLATSRKLFCSCSTNILDKSTKPEASVSRSQRAVAGELGSIDVSAEFEQGKNRSFTYNIFEYNTCLVDVDEEPPHMMNADALSIALSVASSMGMKLIDELQPMRKGVVDGSDPSAFQRTVMIGIEGSIKVDGLKINIPSMFLEEESSGIVSSSSSSVIYNTDRLGIPLLEIDTDPSIPNPKTAKEVALYIGTLLRLTGSVQRGIGSIRQDVNMSIKEGARVEIKGMQELGSIDSFLENEIKRQENLITIKEKLTNAKASVGKPVEVTDIFGDTEVEVIKHNLKDGKVFALALKGFRGLLGMEINPKRRLGTEISDYSKMAGVHGIIHSDEDLSKYGFGSGETNALRKRLGISENDSFIIVAGKGNSAARAAELAKWRADYAMKGVPKETRVAHDNENYTSRFLRPLPTGSRMYPETDVKPIFVTSELRKIAAENAPDVDKEQSYIRSVVKNPSIAEQLILSPRLQLFKDIVGKSNADPEFVANVLIQKLIELRRQGVEVDNVSDESMVHIFDLYVKEKLTKQAVDEAIKIAAKDSKEIDDKLKKAYLIRIKGRDLEKLVEKERKGNAGASIGDMRNRIMARHRLNIDGGELNRLLQKDK
ncbi:MAG: Glu-tRNA(Gln) amidotransferase subunit GatE [Candidatus Micrarchaeota archaeon]|nr:Glu-tRNA(Gln) amidotransferase subunit GatE [Candidatus Micrarchaeota archaeon]